MSEKSLRRSTFETKPIISFNSPGNYPGGLAWDGTYLWNTDWISDIERGRIYKLDPSDGNITTSFNNPISGNVPTGLTWDGTYLWCAESYFEQEQKGIIYKLDPSDGSIITSFNSPANLPVGLTWDGYYLWNADRTDNKIYKIDPGGNEEETDLVINFTQASFGVNAEILNNGTATVYDINWSIDVKAEFGLILSGKHTEGIIDKLAAGEPIKIKSNSLRGIGSITITVQAVDAVEQATAFLLGPLVLRINEV